MLSELRGSGGSERREMAERRNWTKSLAKRRRDHVIVQRTQEASALDSRPEHSGPRCQDAAVQNESNPISHRGHQLRRKTPD